MTEPLMPTRVWDLPTRLFHWVLATCVIFSIVSAQIGGNMMVWHFRSGYVVFTLLVFRLVWGLVGGHWSRFANFIYSPGAVLRYLRGHRRHDEHHEIGHSPLGAFSVFALLGLLGLQVWTGLISDDEIANTGPLIKYVTDASITVATSWHKSWGQWLIVGLIVVHLVAIGFYLLRRKRNLVHPMIIGDKHLPPGVPASLDEWTTRGLAAALLTLCAAGVAWVVSLGG